MPARPDSQNCGATSPPKPRFTSFPRANVPLPTTSGHTSPFEGHYSRGLAVPRPPRNIFAKVCPNLALQRTFSPRFARTSPSREHFHQGLPAPRPSGEIFLSSLSSASPLAPPRTPATLAPTCYTTPHSPPTARRSIIVQHERSLLPIRRTSRNSQNSCMNAIFQRKSTYLMAAVLVAVFSAWRLERWWSGYPSAAFYRHFDMWPSDTVRGIVRSGYTALASSNEYLVFSASPNDIERIIQKRKFEYVGSTPRQSKLLDRERWEWEVRQAAKRGVLAERLYETGREGSVDYVLITNADSTKAYYHLDK